MKLALTKRGLSVAARPLAYAGDGPKRADPFYLSPAWRGFSTAIKRQRGYRCEGAGHEGDPDMTMTPRALIADHIVERRDGGADLDPLNIQLLCAACHARKTAAARAARTARP